MNAHIRMHLLAPHTHQNQPYDIGETITVDGATADWLTRHGVARAEPAASTRRKRWLESPPGSDAGNPSVNPSSENDHEQH